MTSEQMSREYAAPAYSLGPVAANDARELARLHRRAFPGFFLSQLGEGFLVQFYLGFTTDSTAVTVVARDAAGTPRGAVVGTTEPAGFFGRLLKLQWPGFLAAAAAAVLRHPRAIPKLLRAVRYRGDGAPGCSGALLSSICVDPGWQDRGLGHRLMEEWARGAAGKGASEAFLTTDAIGNDAVNAFYRSQRWELNDVFETREGRRMNRFVTRLDSG